MNFCRGSFDLQAASKPKNIAVLAVLTIVCVWMAGCAGCNPEPVPTGMSPTQGARNRWNNCPDYRRKI